MGRTTDTKTPKRALLLICEGNRTEPIFFSNFISKADFAFDISPRPQLSQDDIKTRSNRGTNRRAKRQLQGNDITEDVLIVGAPPKSWIDAAEKKFDTYEEIWCVFDKDGHPTCLEAFEKAEAIKQSGYNLNIAFSSISIEYYFLLHFEYIYKPFCKSECKASRKEKANCMLQDAVPGKSCLGDRCVNGYARSKGYWTDSKSNENIIFPILKDKLFIGIRNAELLRRESDHREGNKPCFDRNPYTTVDFLVARLLGYHILNHDTITTKTGTATLSITKNGTSLTLLNEGKASFMVNSHFIVSSNGSPCVNRCILGPNETIELELPGNVGDIYFINDTIERIIIIK